MQQILCLKQIWVPRMIIWSSDHRHDSPHWYQVHILIMRNHLKALRLHWLERWNVFAGAPLTLMKDNHHPLWATIKAASRTHSSRLFYSPTQIVMLHMGMKFSQPLSSNPLYLWLLQTTVGIGTKTKASSRYQTLTCIAMRESSSSRKTWVLVFSSSLVIISTMIPDKHPNQQRGVCQLPIDTPNPCEDLSMEEINDYTQISIGDRFADLYQLIQQQLHMLDEQNQQLARVENLQTLMSSSHQI